jgi:methyltransferase
LSGVAWAVGLVAAQRLAELALARHNTRRLLARGGIEVGAGHYPFIVALHLAWLGALITFIPAEAPVRWAFLAPYILLQPIRLWIIVSLGRRWTTRVIVLPGAPPVTRGPYRLLRHPNYAVVAAEIALLPLAFGGWAIAAIFSTLNALALAWRIRIEDAALAGSRGGHANVYGVGSAFERESGT